MSEEVRVKKRETCPLCASSVEDCRNMIGMTMGNVPVYCAHPWHGPIPLISSPSKPSGGE